MEIVERRGTHRVVFAEPDEARCLAIERLFPLKSQALRSLRRYVLVSKTTTPELEDGKFEWIYEVPAGADVTKAVKNGRSVCRAGAHRDTVTTFL